MSDDDDLALRRKALALQEQALAVQAKALATQEAALRTQRKHFWAVIAAATVAAFSFGGVVWNQISNQSRAAAAQEAATKQVAAAGAQAQELATATRNGIRTQLYKSYEHQIDATHQWDFLNSLYTTLPAAMSGDSFRTNLLGMLTTDQLVLRAGTAEAPYDSMFGADAFSDARRSGTEDVRRAYVHAQEVFYSLHVTFDYAMDGTLEVGEWNTWRETLLEMNAHPILLAVIWQGARHHYISRSFGEFLRRSLAAAEIPCYVADHRDYERDRAFIALFLPEMMDSNWPGASFPEYYGSSTDKRSDPEKHGDKQKHKTRLDLLCGCETK